MDIIGLILGVLSIVATILLSEPTLQWLKRRDEQRKRKRWSADLHVEAAEISELKHYACLAWDHKMRVDAMGNVEHAIDAHIINMSDKLLDRIAPPIYSDARDVNEAYVKPWAKSGRTALRATVADWIPARSRGRIVIEIKPPLAPREDRRIHWGYRLPTTFMPGDDYYNWDVATPHYEITGRIVFAKPWVVQYARWDTDVAATRAPPIIKGNKIHWEVRFPEMGQRITLRLGLTK